MLHPINGPRVYIESTIYIERGPRPSKYIPDPVVTKWRVVEPSEGRAEESVRAVRRGEERRGGRRKSARGALSATTPLAMRARGRASSLPQPLVTTRYLVRELASGRSLSTNKQTDPSAFPLFHSIARDSRRRSSFFPLFRRSFPSKERKVDEPRSLLGAAPRFPVVTRRFASFCWKNTRRDRRVSRGVSGVSARWFRLEPRSSSLGQFSFLHGRLAGWLTFRPPIEVSRNNRCITL